MSFQIDLIQAGIMNRLSLPGAFVARSGSSQAWWIEGQVGPRKNPLGV